MPPTTIPNFMDKFVKFTGLKREESLNGKVGIAIEWNGERERFGVKLFRDENGSVKWVKPINLELATFPMSESQTKLFNDIFSQDDFNHGLMLFDKIQPKTYIKVNLKIKWLGKMIKITLKDRRYMSKIKKELEQIVEDCIFPGLLVTAKILLCRHLLRMNEHSYALEISMTCIKDHYGRLPDIFQIILTTMDLSSELENGQYEMFEKLKEMYEESKKMILNKTCAAEQQNVFPIAALIFLQICDNFNCLENIVEEVRIIRTILESRTNNPSDGFMFAQLAILESNYEAALRHIECFQDDITSRHGNHTNVALSNCYTIKINCYAALGNKAQAKKALKKLKRFKNVCPNVNVEAQYEDAKNLIENMSVNPNLDTTKEEKKTIRTKMQCSSYSCKNVETHVRDFKVCAKCKLKYYCCRECQVQHWSDGHKKECKKYKKSSSEKRK